jgi:hypothetical protein
MEKLINGKGQIVPGLLDEPVKEINYLDYDLRTVMDRPRRYPCRTYPERGSGSAPAGLPGRCP